MIEQYHPATSYERSSGRGEGLADKKEKMEKAGANTGSVRKVIQAENVEAEYDAFKTAKYYAEAHGLDVNMVFARPDLLEVARAYRDSEEKAREAESPEGQERRARNLAQAAQEHIRKNQSPTDVIPSAYIDELHAESRFDPMQNQVTGEERRRLEETLGIKGSDIDRFDR